MKKTKLLLFALMLTLGVGMLVGCNKKTTKLSKEEITSFAVVTSARLSGQNVGGMYAQDSSNRLIDDKTIDDVHRYFGILEYYLDGGKISNDVVASDYEDEEGNKPYEHMVKYSMPSKDGNIEYVFHYNETLKEEEIEDDEIEQNGVIIHNDEWYYVEISIETEEDEIEKEYLIYKDKDKKDKDYVSLEIEKDLEDNDQTYQYYIYKDGREVHKVKVDLELYDEDKLSIKTIVEVKDTLKFTLDLRQVGDKLAGKYLIENDKKESGKVELKIVESSGLLYYEYYVQNKVIKRARSLR